MIKILFVLFAGFSALLSAQCPHPKFTPESQILLNQESALLVVHASRAFDPKTVSKPGIDRFVKTAKEKKVSVVYLHEPDGNPDNYFYGDCQPTYYAGSYGGEFEFKIPKHIVSSGGFFENCKQRSMGYALRQWKNNFPKENLRVTEAMEASYQIQGFMYESDSYYSAYRQWVNAHDSWEIPLLALMQLMKTESDQLTYMKRYLAALSVDFPYYHRVVIEKDGKPVAVFKEATEGSPTLTFNFVSESKW
jgi:hypothetical protein